MMHCFEPIFSLPYLKPICNLVYGSSMCTRRHAVVIVRVHGRIIYYMHLVHLRVFDVEHLKGEIMEIKNTKDQRTSGMVMIQDSICILHLVGPISVL